MSISTLWAAFKTGAKTHKPEIMIGFGVVAGAGAIGMAIKQTPACVEAFDVAEAEKPVVTETTESGETIEIRVPLTWKEKLYLFGKYYWSVAALESLSVFLIVYGSKIRLDGYTALMAVYGLTKAERDDLKKIIDSHSDSWKKKFQEKAAEMHMDETKPEDIPEPMMSNTEVPMPLPLFWDDQARVYFRASEEDLRNALAEFTHAIDTDPFQLTSMNHWMSILDHEPVANGDNYVMLANDPINDGPLKYQQIGVKESPTGEPARMMRFSRDYHPDTRSLYPNV